MTTPDTVDAFRKQCSHVRAATNDHQRRASLKLASHHAAKLTTHRDELVKKMNGGWSWLDANPDSLHHDDNEDVLLAWLREYEGIEDALRAGLRDAFGAVPEPEQRTMVGVGM